MTKWFDRGRGYKSLVLGWDPGTKLKPYKFKFPYKGVKSSEIVDLDKLDYEYALTIVDDVNSRAEELHKKGKHVLLYKVTTIRDIELLKITLHLLSVDFDFDGVVFSNDTGVATANFYIYTKGRYETNRRIGWSYPEKDVLSLF